MKLFLNLQKKLPLVLFSLVSICVYSQELDPLVDVDLSPLNPDVRDRLQTFKQEVTDYLSRNKFTNEEIVNDVRGKPYKIRCNFNFQFTAAKSVDGYEAKLVVSVQRNIFKTQNFTTLMIIKDDNWEFTYTRGQAFYRDDLKFNSLTSFLDYYAFMIVGLDDDSWEHKLGTARFQKAQNTTNLALSNTTSKGWNDNTILKAARNTFPQELLNSKYDDFRKGLWLYHFAGLDSLQYNKRQSLERMAQAIELIGKTKKSEIRSFIIKSFFDTKYLEIAKTFVDYYDKSIYRRLMDIDPEHSSIYQDWSTK